jgi:hypothetical protein
MNCVYTHIRIIVSRLLGPLRLVCRTDVWVTQGDFWHCLRCEIVSPTKRTQRMSEQLASVTTSLILSVSRAAGRSLVNLLLLDISKTGIQLGGI